MGGFSTLGGGISWEEIKQKLESEGAKNKQYDIDSDGLVENIGFKSVAELPATPEDYEIVLYRDAVKFYDPNKEKWASLWYLFGYDRFDNHGGGVWTKYINIPITTTPSEYAQYKVVIDSNNVTVYSADGTQKAQGAVASDFWANVKSDGSDIRVFDQAKEQLYFWIEEWDYSNKKAVIWVNLTAGSSELNIAYGNPSATKSDYENGEQVFEFFDDFDGTELDTNKWADYSESGTTISVSNGILTIDNGADDIGGKLTVIEKTFSENIAIVSKTRLATYYTDNTNWMAWMALGDTPDAWVANTGSGYNALARANGNGQMIKDGSVIVGDTALGIDTSQWHIYSFVVSSSGVKLLVDDVEKMSYSETISKTGYIGLRTYGAKAEFDYVYVAKLTDPADFGTPQILEF